MSPLHFNQPTSSFHVNSHPINPSGLSHPSARPRSYLPNLPVQMKAEQTPQPPRTQPPLLPAACHCHPQRSARPRGIDGRFLRNPKVEFTFKVCGWCNTSDTSQCRVGCTTGSEAMSTTNLPVQMKAEQTPQPPRPRPPLLPAACHCHPQRSARPRGIDGRFLRNPKVEFTFKVCGWCNTSATSQWRVGCLTGSEAMRTLCNACGINYYRTLKKAPNRVLDLDTLAQNASSRFSISKEYKRQRKSMQRTPLRTLTINMLLSDSAPLLPRQQAATPPHGLSAVVPPHSNPTAVSSRLLIARAKPLPLLPNANPPHATARLPSFHEITRGMTPMREMR